MEWTPDPPVEATTTVAAPHKAPPPQARRLLRKAPPPKPPPPTHIAIIDSHLTTINTASTFILFRTTDDDKAIFADWKCPLDWSSIGLGQRENTTNGLGQRN